MRGLLLAVLLAASAQAQEWNSSCFGGLNDADTPAVLGNCESPDLLNVEANLSGTAILKRKGFSNTASLTIATAPVTGSHSFIDSAGNRLDIVCQDRNCSKSTNGNAFTTFLTTAATGITRWSFVDQGGILYGANDRRDPIFRYDGTTFTSPIGMPQGSILELTQDRLAIGDISGEPNRIHFSSAGAYEQFTVGVNPEDSFFDDVGASGDRVRGIRCIQGSCFVFKTASITLYDMGDQYTTQASVISPNIGTTDPASIVAAGADLYFRAQDKNYWRIGRGGLEQISKKIPNLVKSQSGGLGGGEQTNTQTTKADWDAGDQTPDSSWNTATYSGSIFPSSVTLVDTSSLNFIAGTIPAALTATSNEGSVQFSTAPFRIYNGDFEDGTCTGSSLVYWDCVAGGSGVCSFDPTFSISGSCGAGVYVPASGGRQSFVSIRNEANDAELYTTDGSIGVLSGGTIDIAALGLSTQSIRVRFRAINSVGSEGYLTSSTFTAVSSISWSGVSGGAFGWGQLDDIKVNRYFSLYQSSATPAFFLSRVFDTAFSTPTGGPFVLSLTTQALGGTNIATNIRSSANGSSGWTAWTAISSGTRIAEVNRYQQYGSTFTTSVGTATPVLSAVSLAYATTGQFVTQCIEPNSLISAWGTLSCAQTLAGNGSLVYYATSAVSCAALPTSTAPVNSFGTAQAGWTQQTNNATLSIATNTAVFIGWRSLMTSATDQAQVDACVISRNEGTPSQPSWAAYDSRMQAVYWTSTIDGAAATNRLLKYDLNLGEWFPFDIAAQAPRVINNELYFGGAAAGTWNRFGLVDSDDGAAINAYWTSKDVGSDSPFHEKDFKTLSILNRNQGTGSMTGTWTNSIGNTGSYTISLSTGAGISYARSNYNLPKRSPQNFMKIRLGNNSSTPFEVLGIGLTWTVLPWKVAP